MPGKSRALEKKKDLLDTGPYTKAYVFHSASEVSEGWSENEGEGEKDPSEGKREAGYRDNPAVNSLAHVAGGEVELSSGVIGFKKEIILIISRSEHVKVGSGELFITEAVLIEGIGGGYWSSALDRPGSRRKVLDLWCAGMALNERCCEMPLADHIELKFQHHLPTCCLFSKA